MEKHTKQALNEKLTLQQMQTLDSLIEVLIRPQRLKRDLFFALLLILMRENDFLQIKAANEAAADIPDYIVSTRKRSKDVYDTTFLLNNYQDYPIKILAIPLSDVILLNALIPDTKETYAMCVDITKFLKTSYLGIPHSFYNVQELKTQLNSFTSPIKNCIFNRYRSGRGGILSVPKAIILRILLNLPIRGVLNLSEACRRMNCIVKEDQVWCRLYNRDFCDAREYDGSWWDAYRLVYVARRSARDVRAREFPDYGRYTESPRWEIIL